MPDRWRPRTLLDALRAAGTLGTTDNAPARCGCGRVTTADMLVEFTTLPATLRAKLAHAEPMACDACRSRLVREGHVSEADLARLLGAPPDVVARIATRTLSLT